jgi:hypothetical protein
VHDHYLSHLTADEIRVVASALSRVVEAEEV